MSKNVVTSRREVVHELKKLGLNAMKVVLNAEYQGLFIAVDTFPTCVIINNNVTGNQVRAYPAKGGKWTVFGNDDVAKEFVEEFFNDNPS